MRGPSCPLIEYRSLFAVALEGDVAQMVERSLSMREALGSMPSFSKVLVLTPQHNDIVLRKIVEGYKR